MIVTPMTPRDLFQARHTLLQSIPTIPLALDAFNYTITGEVRKNSSGKAAAMAKSRQIAKIRNNIRGEKISKPQQLLALFESASHPELRQIMKSAGLIDPSEAESGHLQ
jgi:hypothetical protein